MHASPFGTVAVIGGGIAGLTAAYLLSRRGVPVTLFEASDQFGGLGTFFDYRDRSFERFYHCMLPSDSHLLPLLGELGLESSVYWKETRFGYLHRRRIFSLNSATDLLRFTPLSLSARIRVGLTALYGRCCSSAGLDQISAETWLSRLSGRSAFECFWKPMLQAKYGDAYGGIPALWFWTRLNREKGEGKEVKGYIRGGYKRIIETLVERLTRQGVRLELNSPVESIAADGQVQITTCGKRSDFDRAIVTLPPPMLSRISRGAALPERVSMLLQLPYQGVVNVVCFLKRPLGDYYWVAAVDGALPFQGVVETSVLQNSDDTGGLSVIHMMNYVGAESVLFKTSDSELIERCVSALATNFGGFQREDLIDAFVFRAPFVEPIYRQGYLRDKPPYELVSKRVFLGTASQIYPDVTSWNGSVGMVKELLEVMQGSIEGSAEE